MAAARHIGEKNVIVNGLAFIFISCVSCSSARTICSNINFYWSDTKVWGLLLFSDLIVPKNALSIH